MTRSVVIVVLLLAGSVAFVLYWPTGTPDFAGVPGAQVPVGHSHDSVPDQIDAPVVSKTGPWPKAEAKDRVFLFGRMQVKQENSHQFFIRNEGEADLILRAGNTTCKCTKFGFGTDAARTEKSAVVKPGDTIALTMNWKGGDAPDREFSHGGDVYTNDPEHKVLKYAVQGAIEMPFELLPKMWNVGNVYDDQPGRMTAVIGTKLHDSFKILSIESPSGKVLVTPAPLSVETKVESGFSSGYELNIEVPADIPAGALQEEVLIRIDQQDEPVKVTVTARKQGVIQLQQMAGTIFDRDNMQLQLGSFPASEGREAKMLLIVDEKGMDEPFRISETKADPPFVSATLSPIGPPTNTIHRYLLTIKVPPGRPHVQRVAAAPGFVKLSTNHSSGESIDFSLLLYSN